MTTIGILGAGQLGRMMALAGYPLGLTFHFFDPAPGSPAGQLAPQIVADYNDEAALQRFAAGVDLVTYEFENVPVEAVRFLAKSVPIFPPPQALETAQDRLAEKTLFRRLGIPTPRFIPVDTLTELQAAVHTAGLPAVLKTRRLGYDGKGQVVLRGPDDLLPAWERLGRTGLILEEFVGFERELSILAARTRNGACVFYPLVENTHREGILRRTLAPAPNLTLALQQTAEGYARSIMDTLSYVGVLAVELFETGGALLANEIAPRVHNSGHWTQNGAYPDQFSMHLMAGLGLPVSPPIVQGCSAMVNLIGELPDSQAVLQIPEARLHLYAKSPRPGRKLGHINLCAASMPELKAALARLSAFIPGQIQPNPVLEQE